MFLSIDLSSATFNVTELPFESRLYVFPTFSPLFFFVLTDVWIVHASYRSSYAPLEDRLYFYPSSQVEFVSQFSTDSTNNFSASFFCASFRMSFHFSSKSTDTGNIAGFFFFEFQTRWNNTMLQTFKKNYLCDVGILSISVLRYLNLKRRDMHLLGTYHLSQILKRH